MFFLDKFLLNKSLTSCRVLRFAVFSKCARAFSQKKKYHECVLLCPDLVISALRDVTDPRKCLVARLFDDFQIPNLNA